MQKNFPLRFGLTITLLIMVAAACVKKEIAEVAVPSVTGVSKSLLHVGDTLVITGSGFSPKPSDDQVAIATSSLTVTQASTTQLSAVIQTGTQSGQLTVSLPGGKSAVWDSALQIIGATQPYVSSITPNTAWNGDTIIIRGGNFGVPGSTNDVVISGITCTLYNATDSLLRVILPDNVHSGPLTVTTNGVTSPSVNFTVQKVSPLQDGRLYFVIGSSGYQTTFTQIYRGADSAFSFPYGTVAYSDPMNNEFALPYGEVQQGYGLEPLTGDAQGNAYYLYNLSNQFGQASTEYQVIKLSFNGGSITHTVLQDKDWGSDNTTLTTGFPYPVTIPVAPDFLSIDGSTLYEHIGVTNTWYTADLNAATPTFVRQQGILNDSTGFGLQFTPNYLFYNLGGSNNYYSISLINQVRYLHRGSDTTTKVVPIPAGESVLMTLSAPGHGDNILLFTETSDATPNYKIYKFNPSGPTLQQLYGPGNWTDASQPGYIPSTTGLLWAGSHIYYTDSRHSPRDPNGNGTYNGLYVINDDGSSTTPRNIYPRLEPATLTSALGYFPLFAGKL